MNEVHSVLSALPLTPGPFVKAPAMLPFRPVLHWWEGQLAVHNKVLDNGGGTKLNKGYYANVTQESSLDDPEVRERIVDALIEYDKRCTEYHRHLRLCILRYTEKEIGILHG